MNDFGLNISLNRKCEKVKLPEIKETIKIIKT